MILAEVGLRVGHALVLDGVRSRLGTSPSYFRRRIQILHLQILVFDLTGFGGDGFGLAESLGFGREVAIRRLLLRSGV